MNKTVFKPIIICCLLLVFSSTFLFGQERPKIIFDEDFGELNDGPMALAMLIQSGEVDVLGVTSVAGGYWVESETAYALRLLEILGREDIPVYQGAGIPIAGERKPWLDANHRLWGNPAYLGAWGRGPRPPSYMELNSEPYGGYPSTKPQPETAVDFIVETVKKYPHEVTLFCVGPMTNVALAIRKNPEIIPLIKEVYYMGGAFDVPGNTTPAAEFNWWFDPESAKMSVRAPFKKQVIVPLDATELPEVSYTKELNDKILEGPDTPLVQMYRDIYNDEVWANRERPRYVWDAVAAAIFLRPDLVDRMEERYVDVDAKLGLNYGRSVGFGESRRRSFCNPRNFPAGTQKVEILFKVHEKEFWDLFIDLMTKPYSGGK